MGLFGREPKEPEMDGWQIITRHNEALGKTTYRVYLPGYLGHVISRRPEWRDFDNYNDALAYYHEMTGWSVEKVEQP